mmetsp:Transcript_61067/g.68371  ORF Transcript_61067/g.68371 Transcript_61067/m.68371 type:complete len:101 (-) Transcript_61067:36-338(-)
MYKIASTYQNRDEIKLIVSKTTSSRTTVLLGSRTCRCSGSYSIEIVQSIRVPNTKRIVPRNMQNFAILLDDNNNDDDDDDDDNDDDEISLDIVVLSESLS